MKYNTPWTDDEETKEKEKGKKRENERKRLRGQESPHFFIGNSITFSTSGHTGPLTRVHYKKKKIVNTSGSINPSIPIGSLINSRISLRILPQRDLQQEETKTNKEKQDRVRVCK